MSQKQGQKDNLISNNVDNSFISILQSQNNNNNTSKQYYHSSKSDSTFLAITIHTSNSLRLHSITSIQSNQLNSIVTANFPVEGLIQSFVVHPSNQYVLILSNVGYVYIFNLKSSELRGRIDIPKHSQRICIDPSGLYLAISAFGNINEESENYLNGNIFNNSINSIMRTDKSTLTIYNPHKEVDLFFKKKPDAFSQMIKYNKEPVRVVLYEIGTGNLVGEIPSLFSIESLQISDEGKFITIGSTSGIVSIWSTCPQVRENIFEVLDKMRVKQDFWTDFPIYLSPKENILEENNLNDYQERSGRKAQDEVSVNLSTRSIQIGSNYYQKQGLPKTGRESQKGKDTSRIIDIIKPQRSSQMSDNFQQQKVKSMNFYDTQNKLPISSVGGTMNNIQAKLLERNLIQQSDKFDRFYRSNNDLSTIEKQSPYHPQKYDAIRPPQESQKTQQEQSNLTKQKLTELNFKNRDHELKNNEQQGEQQYQNIPLMNYTESSKSPQKQVNPIQQQQQQQRKSIGNGQFNTPSQFKNYLNNPREKIEEPSDIDDDVQVILNNNQQSRLQESPGEVAWRQQQNQNQNVKNTQQLRKPINEIRGFEEYDIPSPSSVRQSERSDSQYDQIDRFETKLKTNKILQQQYQFQKQY